MKFNAALLACILAVITWLPANAQSYADTTVYLAADKMPEFPGGMDALKKAIAAKLVYPAACADSGIQGKVYMSLVVNEDGSVSKVAAIKGPHPLLNGAAIEAVKLIGKFIPAELNGKPVKAYFSFPVTFKIGAEAKSSPFDFYPGGYVAFDTLVANNIRYPAGERELGIEAVITVVCSLNDKMKLEPVRVENNLDSAFNKEAVRLVKLMAPFNGKIKESIYAQAELYIRIHFDLPFKGELKNYFAYRKANTLYYDAGVKYFKQNNFEKAQEYFDACIDYYPHDAEAFFNRAITRVKLKNESGACDDFKRAYLFGLMDARQGIEQYCR